MSAPGSVPRLLTLLLWGAAVAAGLWCAALQNGNRTLAVRAQHLAVSSAKNEQIASEQALRNRESDAALDDLGARPGSVEPTHLDRSNEAVDPSEE